MDAPRIVPDGVGLWGSPHRRADAGLRLGAFLIDLVFIAVWAVCVGIPCHVLAPSAAAAPGPGPALVITALAVLGWAGPLLYFVLLECSPLQGTLGKCLVGIRVNDMDGRRITLVRSAGRTLAKLAFGLAFPPSLLFSLGLIAGTKSRQAIHDGIADTLVLLTDDIPPGGSPNTERDIAPAVPQTRPDGITPSRDGVREPGP